MQNYAQLKTLIFTHYITYLSFQLLRNHRILQHINYVFLYLKVFFLIEYLECKATQKYLK